MIEPTTRMTTAGDPPTEATVADWIGKSACQYWQRITQLIEQSYPGVFAPEWLFGGKKHGWSLRYKKNKSFCTLVPERNRLALMIVFGAEERNKVGAIRDSLSKKTQRQYDQAATYHDGKWVLLTMDSDRAVKDAMLLLAVKRRPRIKKET